MMSDIPVATDSRKEALKKLKAARKAQIAAATKRMQEQRRAVKAIKGSLAESELTVPELAQATGLPLDQVLWYVASMKKYGEILEGPKAGDYYRYKLGQPAAPEAEADTAE
jgi:hypothetical protein